MRGDEGPGTEAERLNDDPAVAVAKQPSVEVNAKPVPSDAELNGLLSPMSVDGAPAEPVAAEEPMRGVMPPAVNGMEAHPAEEHIPNANGGGYQLNGHATESQPAEVRPPTEAADVHTRESQTPSSSAIAEVASQIAVANGTRDKMNVSAVGSPSEDKEKTPIPELKLGPRSPSAEDTDPDTTPRPRNTPGRFVHQPTLPPPNLRPQSILFNPDEYQYYDAEAVTEAARARSRPQSILTEPLTHPNGVSMFPDLTTQEQDALAWEAATQVESVIDPDSDEAATSSVVGGSSTATDGAGGETDSDDGRSDAGYASDARSSASTSVESTVRDFMFENGRRYHRYREGRYNFPNDEVEQEREDMKHAMVKLLCSQKLHYAPIGPYPQQVLDVGTGTGIWAIEMADKYPSANVLGIDLSPIQPDWVPPNARFMVDDIESAWLYPRNHFDYIHSRHTVMAIKDWMRLFRRAYEHIKPGGWIELQEIHHCPTSADNSMPPDHPVARYWDLITEGLAALGVNFHAAADGRLADMAREAGFVNVTERVLHVPIGTWPRNKVLKQVGVYWRTILMDGIQAIALGPLTRGLRWTREQVEIFLVDVRRAYFDTGALMFMRMHIIYGQKPLDSY